jgi:4-hydroxy-tetrahydrodipicolinate synthase
MFTGSSVALITPMQTQPDGSTQLDLEAWDRLLAWHAEAGTQAVVVGGTTGESATLDHEEYIQLLTHAVERLKGQVVVMAGTGSPSTAHTVARTRLAASLGADMALVVTPAYNRPSQRGLMAHYRAVADQSEIPIMLYNVPSRTAVDLLPETALALAEHEQIVAIKEAVGDTQRVDALVEGGLAVFSGDDPSFVAALQHGAQGVVSVAANVVPATFAQLCQSAAAGDWDSVVEKDSQLADLYTFLGVETNPVPVKWLLAEKGMCQHAMRLPLVGLDSKYHETGYALLDRLTIDPLQ